MLHIFVQHLLLAMTAMTVSVGRSSLLLRLVLLRLLLLRLLTNLLGLLDRLLRLSLKLLLGLPLKLLRRLSLELLWLALKLLRLTLKLLRLALKLLWLTLKLLRLTLELLWRRGRRRLTLTSLVVLGIHTRWIALLAFDLDEEVQREKYIT